MSKSVRFNTTVQVRAHAVTLGCYSGGMAGGPPIQLDWKCLYETECPLASPPSTTPHLIPKSSTERIELLLDAGIDVSDMWDAEAIANVVRLQRRESSRDHLRASYKRSVSTRKGLSPQGKRALLLYQSRRR